MLKEDDRMNGKHSTVGAFVRSLVVAVVGILVGIIVGMATERGQYKEKVDSLEQWKTGAEESFKVQRDNIGDIKGTLREQRVLLDEIDKKLSAISKVVRR